MTRNKKIRKYRIVLKEVRPKDLLRSQTQSTNRLWMGALEQPAFFWKTEIQIDGRTWSPWMLFRSTWVKWQIHSCWRSWGLILLCQNHFNHSYLNWTNSFLKRHIWRYIWRYNYLIKILYIIKSDIETIYVADATSNNFPFFNVHLNRLNIYKHFLFRTLFTFINLNP